MPALATSELDRLVHLIDVECNGDVRRPTAARYSPLDLRYDTRVDETLSPFSPEYFAQQVALYEEVAGRRLDQASGELHPVDVQGLARMPNPLGVMDPSHMAEDVRTLSTLLSICGLAPGAQVLDMGAGHGVSSEVFAFCGCSVHAVDIDPGLGELSRTRSAARHFAITRSTLNFDQLDTLPDGTYHAAFFYQSLHHCLKPWELVATLRRKLVPGGVIAFAGEPIQDTWWKHWGIRLDLESVYVARKFGWFESGWSREFIAECFERGGFRLHLLTGGTHGGYIGVAGQDDGQRLLERAARIGCRPLDPPPPPPPPVPPVAAPAEPVAISPPPPARFPRLARWLARVRAAARS